MTSKRGAGVPQFSRLAKAVKTAWFKAYTNRRNRRAVKQTRDIENHRDKPLDPWSLD